MTELLYKELSYAVVGAAMEAHRHLGSGFLEAVDQKAMAHELTLQRIPFEERKSLEVYYKDQLVGEYRPDFLIDGKIIVELKPISALGPAHDAQAMGYLAATGWRLAILINFGGPTLKSRRIVR